MDIIGNDCSNIIIDYKYQLDHIEKFKNCLRIIKLKCINCDCRINTYCIICKNRKLCGYKCYHII